MKFWKKLLCLLLASILLVMAVGCQSSEPKRHRDDDEREEERDDDSGAEALPQGDVAYEIVERDNSIRNDNGDILVRVTYDQVVLKGGRPEYESINRLIEAECDAFLANHGGAAFYSVEELEEMVARDDMGYDAFFSTSGAEVTHNSDGIFSIRIGSDWFMGGVYNANNSGLTYDVRTGEALGIAELLQLSDEEALAKVSEVAYAHLVDCYGDSLFVDPMEILSGYTLENYKFYVENGELILLFDTYEFAPGASGAAQIHTGLRIGA